MRFVHTFIAILVTICLSAPAYAANWGQLKKGACEGTTGKRIYIAKLKRNFGDDPAASLCPRLHKTINGKSRVPDKCEKKGLNGYVGIWLEPDASCIAKDAIQKHTPRLLIKPS